MKGHQYHAGIPKYGYSCGIGRLQILINGYCDGLRFFVILRTDII